MRKKRKAKRKRKARKVRRRRRSSLDDMNRFVLKTGGLMVQTSAVMAMSRAVSSAVTPP